MAKINDIITYLESLAPSSYQESYDNSGLIVGRGDEELKGVLICLDSTEEIVEEAIEKKCNLIIAHHPIVFKGMKRFNGKNYVERTIIKAIKNDIAIYAIHTNLDNVKQGVNAKIAEKIGLANTRILAPKNKLQKLSVLIPTNEVEKTKEELIARGGKNVSFSVLGALSYEQQTAAMIQLELDFPLAVERAIRSFLVTKNYNFHISNSSNMDMEVGAGMIGELLEPLSLKKFLKQVKKNMNVGVVKYTQPIKKEIKTVAVCGGSGGFLLPQAIRQKADVFITSDYKYHEFFDADGQIIIADIGHYESEQFTIQLLYEILSNKFTTFALFKTCISTNPVNYL